MKTKTIQISDTTARQLYNGNPSALKSALEETFGKEFFQKPVEERINSFEDVLSETGRPSVPDFSCVPEDLRDFFKATYKCVVIAEAFNEGERIDIYNSDKYRHYPYFLNNGSASAFGLCHSAYVCTYSGAGSGSRLSLLKSENAKIVGEKFKNEFRDMLSL